MTRPKSTNLRISTREKRRRSPMLVPRNWPGDSSKSDQLKMGRFVDLYIRQYRRIRWIRAAPPWGNSEYGVLLCQFCFPALYWARAALRPLITLQRLDPTVSREDGLLCSRLLAGGINGRMTLILSGTGATVPCAYFRFHLGLTCIRIQELSITQSHVQNRLFSDVNNPYEQPLYTSELKISSLNCTKIRVKYWQNR